MNNNQPTTSLFPPMFGGYGIGLPSVVIDQGGLPSQNAPKPEEPTKRPYTFPFGFGGQFPGFGPYPLGLDFFTCWAMRRYPMVVKVHARVTKPVLAGTRSIEIEDDGGNAELAKEIKKAAERDLLPMLAKAMSGAMEAPNFGHWLSEIIWDRRDGRITPVDVRSVLPGECVIHVDEYRRFTGYQIAGDFRDAQYGFLAVHDAHIDAVLGHSLLEASLATWFRATKSAENADAIERKAAGIQMLMHIMQGVELLNADGSVADMKSVLTSVMNAAVQGKSAIIPDMAFSKEAIESRPELAKVPLMRVDKFDWGDTGPALEAHLSRKRDLDVEICSAWGVPERAVMESEHGSRADAEAHGDVVLYISEQLHANACIQWDAQITERWLAANYSNSKIRICTHPAPLADQQQAFLQRFVTTLAKNQKAGLEILRHLDHRHLLEQVEVPVQTVEDGAGASADSSGATAGAGISGNLIR